MTNPMSELTRELRLLRPGISPWTNAGPALSSLLGGQALIYRPLAHAPASNRFQVLHVCALDRVRVENATNAVGLALTYDPRRVQEGQRNRVSLLGGLVRSGQLSEPMVEHWQGVTTKWLGRPLTDQIRLLVCEGASVLSWVGAVQFDEKRPFGERERRLLQRVAPAIIERLQLDWRLAQEPLLRTTLEELLEATEQPAWLITDRGHITHANVAGCLQLGQRSAETRASLLAAAAGDHRGFRVAEVRAPGLPRLFLVIARGTTDAASRLVGARVAWNLKARESEVLGLVVRGLTNEAIRRERNCSTRTVELQLSKLFEKARVENRASLIARFWTADFG